MSESLSEIPEGGWPSIPVVAPLPADPLEGELLDTSDPSVVTEIVDFYVATLVPQLACLPDGRFPPLPSRGIVEQDGVSVVGVRRDGVLVGAWLVRDGQLLYPCAVLDNIAGIFRALWDESKEQFDYLWGKTDNPVIMAFAAKAVRVPPSPNSPTIVGDRIEWRRPE